MKIKNKFLTTGLIAGIAIFGNVSSAVAQACYQMPGKLSLVTAEAAGPVATQYDSNQLYLELMKSLNSIAQKACLGGKFCFEASGTKYEERSDVHGYQANVSVKVTATVNCLR